MDNECDDMNNNQILLNVIKRLESIISKIKINKSIDNTINDITNMINNLNSLINDKNLLQNKALTEKRKI